MSLKPLIADPAQLKQTDAAQLKAELPGLARRMLKKHHSRETAIPFFMDLQAEYKGGQQQLLFLCGKLSAWKKHIKQRLSEAEALRGYCFIEASEAGNGFVLQLMPTQGKAKKKIDKLQKALKQLISPAKLRVELVPGEFSEDDPALQALAEAADAAPEDPKERAGAEPDPKVRRGAETPKPQAEKPSAEQAKLWAAIQQLLPRIKTALQAWPRAQAPERKGLLQQLAAAWKLLQGYLPRLPEAQRRQVEQHALYLALQQLMAKIPQNQGTKPEPAPEPKPQPEPARPAQVEEENRFKTGMQRLTELFRQVQIQFAY